MKNFVKTLIKIGCIDAAGAFGVFGGIIALSKLLDFIEKRKLTKERKDFLTGEFKDINYFENIIFNEDEV